jgi:hypothetical protein
MTAPTPAEVIAKLGELTPDEIARLFADEDIVGEPGAADECPVARYVHRQTGEPVSVNCGAWGVDGHHGLLPESVKAFVTLFDSGRYPHLIEEEVEDL